MESTKHQSIAKLNSSLLRWMLQKAVCLLAVGSVLVVPCWLQVELAHAQTVAQSPSLSKNTIYVNPEEGNDAETGKKSAPLQTITKALEIAPAGSTIQLAVGTYSEDTGETFPIVIEDQITLQGDPRNQGYKTIIKGDGYFVSPTGAGQNIAIAALEDANTITGITVTNNHSRGHGIWIESASPKIISNTFTRSGNTGVSVNGKSSPRIEDNYFYNNSGNGLLVYGTSQPEIIKNTFEQTGFGISLVQDAVAQITDNQFDGNRIGIILEGNAQATLRQNKIINSAESGLTAIAQSRVDLGTNEALGNNIFRSNKKLDIENATDSEIVAVGTEVQGETTGNINLEQGSFVASTTDDTFSNLPPLPSRDVPKPIPQTTPQPAVVEPAPSNLPPPPPVLTASETGNKELVFSSPSTTVAPDVEPVPYAPSINTTPSPALVKYKVLVEVLDDGEESEVRSLYPEAFETIYQGDPWLQIGAFSSLDKAKNAEDSLANMGLATYLIE